MATTFEVLYLGTGPRIDVSEGNNLSENDSALVGQTYGSAVDPLAYGAQKTFSPVDYSGGSSTMYDVDNALSNDTFSIDGGPSQTLDGLGVYNATITYTDGTPSATITATVFQDTAGNLYLAPETSQNADYFAMIAAPIESLTLDSRVNISSGRLLADRASTDFVCYASGTRILTDNGEVRVDRIRPGDNVLSLDHGPVEVRWVRTSTQPLDTVREDQRPVLICAGSLGPRTPARNLVVSPQHRVLVGGQEQLCDVFADQVFVPAKALTVLPRIRFMRGKCQQIWVHFACDRHEVVRANGCWSESLLLGQMAMNAMSRSELAELGALFQMCHGALNGPPVRDTVGAGQAMRLICEARDAPATEDAA